MVDRKKIVIDLDECCINDPVTTPISCGRPRVEFSEDGTRARLVVDVGRVLGEDICAAAGIVRGTMPETSPPMERIAKALEAMAGLPAAKPSPAAIDAEQRLAAYSAAEAYYGRKNEKPGEGHEHTFSQAGECYGCGALAPWRRQMMGK